MTSPVPLTPPGAGSLPPLGIAPGGRSTPAGVGGGTGGATGSDGARQERTALPGRAPYGIGPETGIAAETGARGTGGGEPLRPGGPLIGGGPFTLAVAFGLQAEQTRTAATASSAGSPVEAAEIVARNASEEEDGGANQLTEEEEEVVRELQERDREVRQHEAAHAAAGGQYAGSPRYTYQLGPDGRQYAVGGSVSIDTAPVDGDPEATLQKARQVRAAALAPADPSSQDRSVASAAAALERQALAELAAERRAEQTGEGATESAPTAGPAAAPAAGANPAASGEDGTASIPQAAAGIGGREGAAALPLTADGGDERDAQDDRRGGVFDLAGIVTPRSSGFDGRTPPPQIVSITV